MQVRVENLNFSSATLTVEVGADSMTVDAGEIDELTVPSTFEADHRIHLSAPEGPVPYELRVTF